MAKENTTRFILLGLLNHEALSGYDLKKRIESMIGFFWDVGYGQIYPTLRTLTEENLVTKTISDDSKGPEKSLYHITEAGKEALSEWLKLPEEKEYTKYGILVKLFFGSLLTNEENRERIQSFQERQKQNLQVMKLFKENLQMVIDDEEDHLFYYLTVLFGEKVHQAYLAWAEEALVLLQQKKNDDNSQIGKV